MTVTTTDLVSRLDHLREAPSEVGTLALVVRRPANGQREVLDEGVLDEADGLVGDNWLSRATSRAVAAGRHLDAQLTVMSARMVALLSEDPAEQALAGDQLYIDLDLSHENLPTGTRLAIGDTAVIEVTAKPHNGCKKFLRWFGDEATQFVNSEAGKALRLRGLNARIVTGGVVRPGDPVRRLP
ncbi:MOSC domain-containing protein [Nocardioides sp.]|uniref:MOSC domain-containing protein n=1 Tax=Nocardioides sp. TaxID=35761 RepID=UPI002ED58103